MCVCDKKNFTLNLVFGFKVEVQWLCWIHKIYHRTVDAFYLLWKHAELWKYFHSIIMMENSRQKYYEIRFTFGIAGLFITFSIERKRQTTNGIIVSEKYPKFETWICEFNDVIITFCGFLYFKL